MSKHLDRLSENNQVPFFNGYRPQFYFKPNGKVEKLPKFPKYTNNQKGEKLNDN